MWVERGANDPTQKNVYCYESTEETKIHQSCMAGIDEEYIYKLLLVV
jgi:hypothetical protein